MNSADLQEIELELGITLPEFYKNTMLAYPFPEDSFADEFLLATCKDYILKMNSPNNIRPYESAYFIGSDGGESEYFIGLAGKGSEVYEFSVETSKFNEHSADWDSFLADIRNTLEEIERDEKHMAQLRANKKWWQFWI